MNTSGGMTRRGWLTGLFAALTGAVGKLFSRPSVRVEARSPCSTSATWLVRTRRCGPPSSFLSLYSPLEGKLVIEPTPVDGELLITIHDRQGNVVEHTREILHDLCVHPDFFRYSRVGRYPASSSTQLIHQATTFVYDSVKLNIGRPSEDPGRGV